MVIMCRNINMVIRRRKVADNSSKLVLLDATLTGVSVNTVAVEK